MKKIVSALAFTAVLMISSCYQDIKAQKKDQNQLSVTEVSSQMKSNKKIQLLDVRTPEEYAEGHLDNAININVNNPTFGKEISNLDKSQPVIVYCLSGGRSAKAAAKLKEKGYKVYDMSGGIMKWRAANLPETKGVSQQNMGMDTAEYETMIGENPVLLVDFYADWCEPCKRMKPYLDEIDRTMKDKVKVLRINVDKNKALVKNLGVDALPVLMLYKNKNLEWKEQGFVPKETVLQKLSE